MRILIEEHQYAVSDIRDAIYGIDALESVEGYVSIHYVGYYYNTLLKDCVFILPKVLLKDVDGQELVFGKYKPEDIVNLTHDDVLEPEEQQFIYKFAVWIYRAIAVYKNDKRNDTGIVYHRQMVQVGKGGRRLSNTYLDILLSLIQWARDNQSFVFTVVKNMHSGLNKINWNRTIGTQTAIMQNGQPIYLNPVNKKRQVNFDEELLVIFYSILKHISETYGFEVNIACQFQLITGGRFDTYMRGLGKRRLLQIKYKYFSDKALELWQLCYAFFNEPLHVYVSTEKKEYLLVKDFYIVFEAIIDELVGDNPLPDGMQKKQDDGKIVDHLFTAQSLIENKDKPTYYIGDSKYYKMGHELGKESIYKQYTYARNVIQWNLDLWGQGKEPQVKLRDDVTEGYNIIPNFFVSGKMDEHFDYSEDGITQTGRKNKRHRKEHFKNRLFDRDTLLLFHYDVNFLFVLSLYARNNASQKEEWKQRVRNRFRTEIQDWLQTDYNFYAMQAHPDVNGEEYIKQHFKQVLGKVYAPFADSGVFSLALSNSQDERENNEVLLNELRKSFFISECKLGVQPEEALAPVITQGYTPSEEIALEKDGVLLVMMENYEQKKAKFLGNGKLAVGIKWTNDSMEIVSNIQNIGFVLFHHRNDNDQHLFAVNGSCRVARVEELEQEPDRYRNVSTTEMYVVVDLAVEHELNATIIKSSEKPFTAKTRYDAQYYKIKG